MSPYRTGRRGPFSALLTPSTAWILKSLRGKARTTNSSVPEMIKWSDYNNNNNAGTGFVISVGKPVLI